RHTGGLPRAARSRGRRLVRRPSVVAGVRGPDAPGSRRRALEGNYDLQAAVARIDQARAQIGVAASQFFPQIGYAGTAARGRIPGGVISATIPAATFDVFAGAFNVAWELDLWGRIRRSTE